MNEDEESQHWITVDVGNGKFVQIRNDFFVDEHGNPVGYTDGNFNDFHEQLMEYFELRSKEKEEQISDKPAKKIHCPWCNFEGLSSRDDNKCPRCKFGPEEKLSQKDAEKLADEERKKLEDPCTRCKGSGGVFKAELDFQGNVINSGKKFPCPMCGGTGKRSDQIRLQKERDKEADQNICAEGHIYHGDICPICTPHDKYMERERERQENYKHDIKDDTDIELEINGDTGEIQEKKERDPEADPPVWTEVRGSSSFYCICPVCGSMIPGTGPAVKCADGKERRPKELHEWWHKTIACDWFNA